MGKIFYDVPSAAKEIGCCYRELMRLADNAGVAPDDYSQNDKPRLKFTRPMLDKIKLWQKNQRKGRGRRNGVPDSTD